MTHFVAEGATTWHNPGKQRQHHRYNEHQIVLVQAVTRCHTCRILHAIQATWQWSDASLKTTAPLCEGVHVQCRRTQAHPAVHALDIGQTWAQTALAPLLESCVAFGPASALLLHNWQLRSTWPALAAIHAGAVATTLPLRAGLAAALPGLSGPAMHSTPPKPYDDAQDPSRWLRLA
jgi:hypothetical protein